MSKGFYHFLFYKYCIATRTVFAFRQAGFCTSCRYRCIGYFCVSKGFYHFLFYKYCITTRTVFAFRQASCSACCCYCCVGYFDMSECRRFFLRNKHFVAAGTMFPLGFSGGCACCFDCFVGNFCVTECRSLFILYGSAFIARASHNPFGFARSDRKRSPVAPLVFARAGGKREQRRQYKRAQSNG